MKKILFLLLLLSSVVSGKILFAEDKWRPGPDPSWHIRLEPALEQARRENKFVYVLKTGSDWCGFCKVLLREVLSKDIFADLARKHLVLVYLDSPSQKVSMPQEQRDYNRQTARTLNFGGGVPSAMLLDSNGSKVGSITGSSPEPLYIAKLYKTLNLPGCPTFPAVAKLNLRNRNGKNAEVRVTITKWGTSQNAINKPFNAGEEINVAPGQKVFFEVVYSLPSNLKALLHLQDFEGNKFHSPRGRVTRSGTYIFSAVAPERDGFWGSRTSSVKVTVEPLTKSYRKATAQIVSCIAVKPELLGNGGKVKFAEKVDELREKFSGSRFEIISWGTNRKCENPYIFGQNIKVARFRALYLKLQYKLPGASAIGVNPYKQGMNIGYQVHPASGTYTVPVYVRNRNSSELYISLRPNRGEVLKNIVTIPCNIVVE